MEHLPYSRKRYFDSKTSTRYLAKSNISNMFTQINGHLKRSLGLDIDSVRLINSTEPNNKKIKLLIENDGVTENEDGDDVIIAKTLYAKDVTNMSERKYLLFKKIFSFTTMPSLNKLRLLKNNIDSIFNIYQNEFGFYVDPLEKISFILSNFLEKNNQIGKLYYINL